MRFAAKLVSLIPSVALLAPAVMPARAWAASASEWPSEMRTPRLMA